MLKFLRQHNRKILAVVTAFILISWLVGEPLRDLLSPDPSKTKVGAAFGKTITNGDLIPALNTTTVLQSLGLDWRHLAGVPEDVLRPEHWYLLVHEASRTGIAIPDSAVDDFLSNPQQFPPQLIDFVRQRDRVSPEQIRAAVREYLLVQRYSRDAVDVYEPSDQETRHFVRDTQDKIAVRAVVFRAKDFLNNDEKLDPAEVAAQYEKYRDQSASENADGYGYKWPRRIRVQYLAARIDDVLSGITISDDELRRFYRKNRTSSEYSRYEMRDDPTASQPATAPTTSSTQPVRRKVLAPVPMSFDQARSKIEDTLKRRTAVTRVREAMQRIASDLARPWLAVSPGPDGFKPTPVDVRTATYLSAAKERLEKQYNIPLTYRETELMSDADAAAADGIGKAGTVGESKDRLSFAEYAFRLPGLFDGSKAGETALRLAVFQTTDTPIYTERDGQPFDQFVFRVVEIQEPRVPASLDEVRSLVERDLREKHAYARAEQRAREFFVSARRGGVDQAYKLASDLHDAKYDDAFAPRLTPSFPRRESILQSAADRSDFFKAALAGQSVLQPPLISTIDARSAEFVDRCFDMSSPLWTAPQIEALPTTRPVASAPADGTPARVNYIPLPRLRMAVVAGLADVNLVRSDAYQNRYYNSGRQMLMVIRRMVLLSRWFSPSEIERRCRFVREKTEEGDHVPITPERAPLTPPVF